ncbi:MAG: CBS domain-containing protein [Candidatus Omnitrophica bacterium]|nr:CBS domain-containing protein [Candidatus Omnitrophota bacterium]
MIKTTIGDIMTEHVVKISDNAKIMHAAHILLRFRINGVLIVSSKNANEIKGVVTTTDLLKVLDECLHEKDNWEEKLETISLKPVTAIASHSVVSVQKTDGILVALDLMHKKRIHTIPVYDGDKLVGIVGRHDIINIAFYVS